MKDSRYGYWKPRKPFPWATVLMITGALILLTLSCFTEY